MPASPDDPLDERLADPARLEALDATFLLDSAPEEAFDRLTRLVRLCLRVPVALVSLVDTGRQFFKSQQGLPEPWCSLRETPLSHSFCQHVVTRDAPLVVDDAREDPLVRDNAAIRDLDVVAYLGVPIRSPSGHAIGSLCAIDGVPRAWSDRDREVMEAVAREVTGEIAVRSRLGQKADVLSDALDQSGALLRTLFEAVARPALVLRPDGVVVDANGAALARAGLERETAVGHAVWDVLGLDAEAADRLRASLQTGRTDRGGAGLDLYPVPGTGVVLALGAPAGLGARGPGGA